MPGAVRSARSPGIALRAQPRLRGLRARGFQQHQHRAASARVARRFAIRQDLVALCQPTAYLGFKDRLAVGRGEALAVNHAHAAPAAVAGVVDEIREGVTRLVAVEPMQIELALHGPMPAPQPREHVAGEAIAQKRLFGLELLADLPVGRRGLDPVLAHRERVGFIGEALRRHARWTGTYDRGPIVRSQRLDIGKHLAHIDFGIGRLVTCELARRGRRWWRRLARFGRSLPRRREKRLELGEFCHAGASYSTDSRYASASSAAMQPVPALVTAWR